MDRLFRIDFYPQDWLIDTANLTPDECGLYIQICSLIYARRGPIDYDLDEISRRLKGCSTRLAKSIIERLVEKDKIYVRDGKVGQRRAERELNLKRTHLEVSASGGRTKAENERETKENNGLSSTEPPFPVATSTATASPTAKEGSKRGVVVSSSPEPSAPEMGMAVSLYNEVAKKHGLPLCQKLTESRKVKMRARLKDAGGLEGWRAALAKVNESPFLTGHGEKGWKADIDFMLQESSFIKIIEGNYEKRKHSNETNRNRSSGFDKQAEVRAAIQRGLDAFPDPERSDETGSHRQDQNRGGSGDDL